MYTSTFATSSIFKAVIEMSSMVHKRFRLRNNLCCLLFAKVVCFRIDFSNLKSQKPSNKEFELST